ncbi:MAG: DNA polymerase III subunit gamma/tau [Deltaproteobacteria bacterium]|nr:DNA polymerase III subunit gamma/tau [Deltaproteobacteria bacterium]
MYQVLARKWRPQSFEEVVGQEPVTVTLQNAIAQGRVAHAFLFSGSRGVGKTSVARIFAKALNCEHGPTPHPCNECQACREITSGASLDVLEIDGASNRGIDEVRDLREKIKYVPVQGHYKVYIIDEVHMLTKEAFNALLKTLEEPPPHAIFIMATTEPHKVPVTILSRCQRYDFRRIPASLIQEHLEKLVKQEGWNIDAEGLALVAREAEGSLRDAQGFLDQVVTFGGEAVGAPEIARILGVTERGALLTAVKAIVERQGQALLTLVDDLYNQGHDLKRFYLDLLSYARHLLLAGLHPEARALAPVADSEWEDLTGLARGVPAVHLHNLLSVLLQGEEELRRAPQPRLVLEVLLLKLVHLEPLIPLEDWVKRLEDLERRLGSRQTSGLSRPGAEAASAQPVAAATDAPQPPKTFDEADPDSAWRDFLDFVKREENGPLSAKLAQCKLTKIADHCLHVKTGRTWTLGGAQQEAQLQKLVQAFFGPQYSLKVELPDRKAPPRSKAEAPKPLAMAELKQQALEILGGRWLESQGKEESE